MQDPKKIPEVLKKRMEAWRHKSGRDPKRIAVLLKALEDVWRVEPDLRLGQIIVNATRCGGIQVVCPEIFYLEDDAMLKGIEELAKRK